MKQYIKDYNLKKKGMRLTMKKPEMIEGFKKLGHWKELSSKQAEVFSEMPRVAIREKKLLGKDLPFVETEHIDLQGRIIKDKIFIKPPMKPTTLEPPQELSTTVSNESDISIMSFPSIDIIVPDKPPEDTSAFEVTQDGIEYIVTDDGDVFDEDYEIVGKWDFISKSIIFGVPEKRPVSPISKISALDIIYK